MTQAVEKYVEILTGMVVGSESRLHLTNDFNHFSGYNPLNMLENPPTYFVL